MCALGAAQLRLKCKTGECRWYEVGLVVATNAPKYLVRSGHDASVG